MASAAPGAAELQRQLQGSRDLDDVASLEQVDLTNYLRDTATFASLAPAERLRQLAIAAEPEAVAAAQPRGWLALERLYRAALDLDRVDPALVHSRVLSAIACARQPCAEQIATRIMDAAVAYSRQGVASWPANSESHDTLGYALYCHRGYGARDALVSFDAAIELDPSLAHARLYRAHCLQDMNRWSEAATAYAAVDPAYFVEHRAWRYDLLREQHAWCLLKSGDGASAVEETRRLLERYENEPHLIGLQLLPHLEELADADPTGALRSRLNRLLLSDRTPNH